MAAPARAEEEGRLDPTPVEGTGAPEVHSIRKSTFAGNTAHDNDANGILAAGGSVVRGNAAARNGIDGIQASIGKTVFDNGVFENGDDGIQASAGSVTGGIDLGDNACDGTAGCP